MPARHVCLATLCAIALLAGGCAKTAQQTGFLSDYSKLEPVSSTFMRYVAPNDVLAKYNKFIVDPVAMKSYDAEAAKKITPEDQAHLEQYMYETIRKTLGGSYTLVNAPGPDVARIRIAITNLKAGTPALNVLPQTKLTGLGLGEASVEFEMLDSQSKKQLAAAIESQQGSRLSLSGLSKWGDVEAVMNDWAKRLLKRVDEAHGKKQP